ncbi:aminopeptidase P family protein [Candidatus Bathyarchaeota archaeon]|nr:aminopeptidase P family protein [Candidatus Bathyarchaeota archaeon]MBT4319627.1 aminopeptidase P family protein [Candidatus Bathyarchaeota archaeon]MBT6604622.1 aminopeptidase P family protein [Candidatus Bathyarchaeota archaeon]MBT7187329.1 aminopeptidase P family protein [Candidatus Bathyarchaeota archaeon]MBT7346840.1 aminopeptidase P family protein [Candidatus Bathyarchaeota archaeon]
MDYEGRLSRVREAMRERGIALMYLRRGANLFYLTGIKRKGPELTDNNSFGDYIHGAYITLTGGITILAPRMGASGWKKQAEGKPWITRVKILDESERPKEILREVIGQLNMRGKGVAIEERAWAHTVLLFRQVMPYSKLSNASEIIEPMRMIKDSDEIEVMKKAGEITDRVYGKVVDGLERGQSEIDVANAIDYEFRKQGADYNSFVTGVRFRSPNHPWILGESPDKPRLLEDGDTISFDFGCVYDGYCSDFGRTVYVGEPPAKVQEIHDLVMTAQGTAIEQMKEGELTCEQLDSVARGIIERGGYGENFVHRLGHGIGLTVHEPPYLYIPDKTMLQEGMTFTVEPSILLFGEWSARVEDVVLVTKTGGETFSNFHKELTTI